MLAADRPTTLTLLLLNVVQGLLPTCFTLAIGWVVASMPRARDAGSLWSADGRVVVLAILAACLSFVASEAFGQYRFVIAEGFRQHVEGLRREKVMRAAMHPPGIGHLEDKEIVDKLALAAHTDWPDTSAFTIGLMGMVRVRTTALSSGALVIAFRWWAALGLVLLWAAVGRTMRRGQAESYSDTHGVLRRASYLREVVFGRLAAKELRIFGVSTWFVESFSAGWHDVMRAVWKARRLHRVRVTGILAAVLGAHVAFFLFLGNAVIDGELSAARLAVLVPAVFALSSFGATDENTLAVTLGAVALPTMEEVERIFVHEGRFDVPGDGAVGDRPEHGIRFEQVAFTYPTRDRPVYESLDLEIPAGRSLAVVGANGAGKTTFVKLLARLYEPSAGRITVDDTPLTELDARQWQRRVAAIFQDFVQFEFSAADNVGFGAVELCSDRPTLTRAAERVGARDLIEGLPLGWDTVLSRGYADGTELSGGQWQRLALARALMAVEGGAKVLVLDEPTANLDVRAEVELFDRFLDVTRGATTILISHRFSTVRRADRIVVLDAGRVVESGTHDELLDAGGRYARSFRLQAGRYHDGATSDV